ncbi:hypothetical protein CPC08DRAFT_738616 [Agrocybe pediades]|nr:hypothetical protein CPC08DRAFT_738616 [Agrocybe pediades]
MPNEEAKFYSSKVQYLPMCTLDKEGRPWVSILAGEEGRIGYIHYPARDRLQVEATLWEGDASSDGQRSPLFASSGIEISTRARNKFAGRIEEAQLQGKSLKLTLKATQAISISGPIRELEFHINTACAIRRRNVHMTAEERLPDDVIQFILNANSNILGTVYEAPEEDASVHPSHLGANHRGGKPRFLRVVLLDYSGTDPLATLTIISFNTGDILYITGRAKNIHGDEARAIMPLQNLLTEIYVMGHTFAPGVSPQPSPHNPPLRCLAEKVPTRVFSRETQTTATLTRREFRHVHDEKPSLINDDFIHTWTTEARRFSVTLREKKDGTVMVPLFKLAKDVFFRSWRSMSKIPLWWVSGGIVTPFLPMLSAISGRQQNPPYDITFVAPIREADAALQLILSASNVSKTPPWLSVHVFATTLWTIFICGLEQFQINVIAALGNFGVERGRIRREGFSY